MSHCNHQSSSDIDDPAFAASPPRNTLLGTLFSPVFNYFGNQNGKYTDHALEEYLS